MSELVRAVETFACEHGLIHWHSEFSADAEVVKAFPQFFEPIQVGDAPAPKKVAKKAASKAANG